MSGGGGNLKWLALTRAAIVASGLLVSVAIMRTLGREGFGEVAWIQSLIGVATLGSGLAMNQLLTRKVSRDPDSATTWMPRALLLTLGVGLASACLVVVYASVRADSRLVTAAALAAGTVMAGAAAHACKGTFHGLRRMGLEAGGVVAGRLVFVVGQLAVLAAGFGVVELFGVRFAAGVATFVVLMVVFYRQVGSPRWGTATQDFGALFREVWAFEVTVFFVAVYAKADVLMIEAFRGAEEVGLYGGAALIILQLPFIANILTRGIYPRMSRYLGKPEEAGAELTFVLRVLLAVSMPIAIGGMCVAEDLMVFLGRAEFRASGLALLIMLPAVPARFLNAGLSITMSSLDRQQERSRIDMFSAVFNVLANLPAIYLYGYIGAAVTTTVTECLVTVLLAWRVRSSVDRLRMFDGLWRALVPALAMASVILILPDVHVLVDIGVGAVVYAGGAVLTKAVRRSDLRDLRSI